MYFRRIFLCKLVFRNGFFCGIEIADFESLNLYVPFRFFLCSVYAHRIH